MAIVFQDNTLEIQRLVHSIRKINLSDCVDLVAVDNCSSETTPLALFESLNIKKILIRNEQRMSLAFNRNQCVKRSNGSIILFLDSDTEFIQENFLSFIVKNMKETRCDLAAPVIVSPNGAIQSVGFRMVFKTPYFVQPIKYVPEKPEEIHMIHGACFAIRRQMLKEIGMFDEFMEPYNFDEMDLAIRALLKGYKIRNFGDIRIMHHSGGTTSTFREDQRALYFIRHAIRSIKRNYTGLRLLFQGTQFILGTQIIVLKRFHKLSSIFIVAKALIWNLRVPSANLLYLSSKEED